MNKFHLDEDDNIKIREISEYLDIDFVGIKADEYMNKFNIPGAYGDNVLGMLKGSLFDKYIVSYVVDKEERIKLINENSKIHIKLKNDNIKNPKLSDYAIEINTDVKKEIVGFNLEPKEVSKTLVNSQIEKNIGKINSEDYNFMVNIEYAKNPFLTRVKNPNYKREEKK